jgi:hypothetical protein
MFMLFVWGLIAVKPAPEQIAAKVVFAPIGSGLTVTVCVNDCGGTPGQLPV